MIFRTLISQWSSIVISLFLAVFVWAVATNEENPTREDFFPEAIPIQFVNLSPGLMLTSKSAESVHLRIRAPEGTWNSLRPDSFRAVADLKDLSAGEHNIPLSVTSLNPDAEVTVVDLQTVTVRLEALKQVTMEARVRILDDAPVGYQVKDTTTNPSTVTISGPQSLVDQVNDATAEIALRGAKAALDREAAVTLHDAQGNTVQGVTVTPATVSVHVDIVQRVGYKDVAVKAVTRGSVSPGYWVSNISVDPPTVTLVGAPQALDKIPGYVEAQPIAVTGAKADVSKQVGLDLPQGVTALTAGNVNVRISVEPVLGGITILRPVTVNELDCDLPVTVSPDTVEVILSGPLPILQALTSDDVQIIADVNGCSPSSFQTTPRVVNYPDSIKVESIVPNTVEVLLKTH
jgi:YbbR domain-containing protein